VELAWCGGGFYIILYDAFAIMATKPEDWVADGRSGASTKISHTNNESINGSTNFLAYHQLVGCKYDCSLPFVISMTLMCGGTKTLPLILSLYLTPWETLPRPATYLYNTLVAYFYQNHWNLSKRKIANKSRGRKKGTNKNNMLFFRKLFNHSSGILGLSRFDVLVLRHHCVYLPFSHSAEENQRRDLKGRLLKWSRYLVQQHWCHSLPAMLRRDDINILWN
jgi:hypothetical protein